MIDEQETMNLIQTLEQEEIARLGKVIPPFAPGDTVIVSVNVIEGTRKRMQELGIRESQPKKIIILGKEFNPAKADEYVNSFAIKRT